MPAPYRLIAWALGVAGILLGSIGFVLAYTWAYPDIQCSGDFCGITQNAFTIPAILIGAALGIASAILFIGQRFGGRLAAKH